MAGMSTGTAALSFKKALYTTIKTLVAASPTYKDAAVFPGTPGTFLPDDIIQVGKFSSIQEPATMSASQRSREESLTVEVTISCHVGGGEDMEMLSQERALDLLMLIERYVRTTDTTLGGVVRHCFLTSIDSDGATPPEYIHEGRAIDVTAQFEARNRVTG